MKYEVFTNTIKIKNMMNKKLFTNLAAILLMVSVFAQSPEKMSYQAVIRNSSDVLVTNTQVGMKISILQGTADGSPVYVETQTPTTNENGLVSIEIGAGSAQSDNFSEIDWANGPYFIKIETDPAGGNSYSITGVSQLLSVPYALYAKTAENAVPKSYFNALMDYIEKSGVVAFIDFTSSETHIEPNETIDFFDNSLINANSWSWDFGDGNTSNIQNPSNVYTEEGRYTVSLTASDGKFTMTKTKENFINVAIIPPSADFQYQISDADFREVSFINNSQNAVSYSWDFGDGQTSTESSPTHIYAEEGEYQVVLTATNNFGMSVNHSKTIVIKDILYPIAGKSSKTWRLYRIDKSMGVGPSIEAAYDWWFLENDGSRPCVYYHEFTFNRNGEYTFNDNGSFWGEDGIFDPSVEGTCFEAIPENMVNVYGEDVRAWLSGTHQYEYVPSTATVKLIGWGAWIGLSSLATHGQVYAPQTSVSFKIEIEEHDGYDLMLVKFVYDWGVWVFNYASYSDPSLEPEVVNEEK